MLEFELSATSDGRLFLKEELRRLLGCEEGSRKVTGLAGTMVVVLAPREATDEQVLRSLDAMRADLVDKLEKDRPATPA